MFGITQDKTSEFIAHLNSSHPTIKFTSVISSARMDFFDMTVITLEDGTLITDLYTKPTDTHTYLHYRSCHPSHQKSSGSYSQLVRVKRICTRMEDYNRN